jgi:hypothetical protein
MKLALQFVILYALIFLAAHYLPRHGTTVPTIPAAVMALPVAAFILWRIHKQAN